MSGNSGDAFLVAAASAFLRLDQPALEAVEVGQHQLGLHHLDVAQRIDRALHVSDVAVLETAQHVDDGVDLADVGEKLVAETLALRGTPDQPGDIDEFQVVGMVLIDFPIVARTSRRLSGTATRPTLGSMVQNG